ncbi:VOC family protein [Pedobacter jeongneungensis]|uniref:VOC family protein n=1 Tax=Pedobacter jeongneungensis TaxID=947309 RepID=A0ABP8BGU5_9SPHI
MNAKTKIWANYSVKDAQRSNQFYTALGFSPYGPNNAPQLASFLFGANHFVIHFFQQGSTIDEFLAPEPISNNEIVFTLSAETEAEVNEFADKVKNAGGTIVKEVQRDEANYYGFTFTDPDGHKFNVILMDNM